MKFTVKIETIISHTDLLEKLLRVSNIIILNLRVIRQFDYSTTELHY